MDEDEIKEGLLAIARAIHMLGNADASTPMGGLEALGAVILESSTPIANALSEIAESLNHVAEAIEARE